MDYYLEYYCTLTKTVLIIPLLIFNTTEDAWSDYDVPYNSNTGYIVIKLEFTIHVSLSRSCYM